MTIELSGCSARSTFYFPETVGFGDTYEEAKADLLVELRRKAELLAAEIAAVEAAEPRMVVRVGEP